MYRRAQLFVMIGCVFALGALPVHAQTLNTDDIFARINQLLARVQTLQAELSALQGNQAQGPVQGTFATPSPHDTPRVEVCTQTLSSTLGYGDRGQSVTALQQYLRGTGDYTYPEITGYYGSVTQEAVQRWQARRGIVASGTPATTGYGRVGPQTRAAINSDCGDIVRDPVLSRPLVVTPEIGQVPLDVVTTFSVAGSSCASYALDWGDGTPALAFDAGVGDTCTRDIAHKRATHTYANGGVYRVTLRATQGPLATAGLVGETFVSVGAPAPGGISLSPTSGLTPFTTSVTFPVQGSQCTSYRVNWDDGVRDEYEATSTVCNAKTGTQAVSHTYTNPGTYNVTLQVGQAPLSALPVQQEWEVVVNDGRVGSAGVDVAPTRGTAPLDVSVRIYGEGKACQSYGVQWGDGSDGEYYDAGTTPCNDTYFNYTLRHTYTQAGRYLLSVATGRDALGNLTSVPYVVVVE